MARYRGAVIGLGWMGLLYDLADRMGVWHVDDIERPTPDLDVHRRFHYHTMFTDPKGRTTSYSEALADRPEIDLVAAAERDPRRLAAFGERYGVEALYSDAIEMLRREKPEIVAISTNTKMRPELTLAAVEHGARGIVTEKPMAERLEQCDAMVAACAEAGVPLCCGAISTSHPSFARAKELLLDGAIGELLSIDTVSDRNLSQHQNWSWFVDSEPQWVAGTGDEPPRESGSGEFRGQGVMATGSGLMVQFRRGGPFVRLTGSEGEILHEDPYGRWRLFQKRQVDGADRLVEMPWPEPQQDLLGLGAVFGLADVIDCIEGRMEEPKNSGRRVARAIEVEVGLKLSAAAGGERVDLPLADRTLGLEYDWHR